MVRCNPGIWLLALAAAALAPARTVSARAVSADGAEGADYRIGMILWRGETRAEEGFRAYLRHRGARVEYVVRDSGQDPQALRRIVGELADEDLDLVYTFGTTATLEAAGRFDASEAGPFGEVPIVFNIVTDPAGSGLVGSHGHGRNLTGVSHLVPLEQQFDLLDMLTRGDHLGVLYNPRETNSRLTLEALQEVASARGLLVSSQALPVGMRERARDRRRSKREAKRESKRESMREAMVAAIDELVAASVDYVYLPPDSFIIANAQVIVEACHARGIPTISATEEPIRAAGALMGIVSPYWASGQFAAHKALQILRDGEAASDIPIGRLQHFTFLFHMGSAHRLGFYPPIKMFRFAEVIDRYAIRPSDGR